MPQDRFGDDHDDADDYRDDFPHPRKKSGSNPAVIVIAVVVGVLVVGALACCGLFMLGWSRTAQVQAPANAPAATVAVGKDGMVIQPADGKGGDTKRVYTRDEFKALVVMKMEAEVIDAIGKPDRTVDTGDGRPTWHYFKRTRHPLGKLDETVSITFSDGRVGGIHFEP